MALNIIPHDDFELTDGEKKMLNKIKKIYETTERENYLYVQPRIKNLNPDYILVDSLKGVCIIEIKDWSIGYLERATKREVYTVDEYQDFYEDWLRLCIKLCKGYSYKNSKDEEVEGINLFLAGDRLQSIYNPKETSWKSLGIDMRGRSELLKKTYRTGKNHINLALDFLMLEPSLKKEVENFYDGRDNIDNDSNVNNEVKYLEGNLNSINILVKDLLNKCGYKPNNIIILCKTHKGCEKLYTYLDSKIKNVTQLTKEPDEHHMLITTYHSAKGLEAPVCILTDVSDFKDNSIKEQDIKGRKLLYVGMTRASERLYIHANNLNSDSFARQLKELI